MRKSIIIVAGGNGTRMGADIPKQFIELNGKPILMHTLDNLQAIYSSMQLVLVLPKDQFSYWEELKKKHQFETAHDLAEGGKTRFLSVKSGLQKVLNSDVVGVHDGVRPFASKQVIDACFEKASQNGAAIPVVPIVQSLRVVQNGQSNAVDRSNYCAVQTPQCFRTDTLKEAFAQADRVDYSDDATVVEEYGQSISMVDGNTENIKITTPMDLQLAQLIIAGQSNSN